MVHLTKLRCSHLSRRPQYHDEVCDVRFPLERMTIINIFIPETHFGFTPEIFTGSWGKKDKGDMELEFFIHTLYMYMYTGFQKCKPVHV